VTPRSVPFTDHGTTQQSGNGGGPRLVIGADAGTRAELSSLVADVGVDPARVYLGVFAGTQRTGGYGVRIDGIERVSDRLNIRSTFAAPAAGAISIQVITSPAHVVSIARGELSGVREAVLVDQSGSEKARLSVPQSSP
jgi:hypothetical protein